MAVVRLEVAAPVAPELPELPDTATGLAVPRAEAAPVLPVLVALDWEEALPLNPVKAVGATVRLEAPPAPPLA